MDEMFITYHDEASKSTALVEMSKGLQSIHPVVRKGRVNQVYGSTIYKNVGPGNTSLRDGFNRRDYEYYRRDETIPETDKDIILACMQAYDNISVVKNTIDMMTDLVVQGIDIQHEVDAQERFYKRWFHEIVMGPDRSERMTSLVYRGGTAVITRQTAVLGKKDSTQMQKVSGASREVPWHYTILNPLSVDIAANPVADLFGSGPRQYTLRITKQIIDAFADYGYRNTDPVFRPIPNDLLTQIMNMARNRRTASIPLNPDSTEVVSYKKDDWQLWAKPICHAILDDLNMLQKMRLADLSALDGAISQIRLWKLGDLENKIFPKKDAFSRLADVLINNVSGGVMDIMWGPAIELIETGTDLHHFLGETKYIPVMKAIFTGLGLPSILSGYGGAGFTNNVVELKVLVQRLKYVRYLLTRFWAKEIKIVQKAMGFDKPATLTFDYNFMDDEATIINVLLSAVDRNLISDELFQERIGASPNIERSRIRREWKKRQNGTMPQKASPFQQGSDIPLDDHLDILNNPPNTGPKGEPSPGRPPGKKDQVKRKQKVVKPLKAEMDRVDFVKNLMWAEAAQKQIGEVITPLFLKTKGKENVRQLASPEYEELEDLKFSTLANLSPGQEFTEGVFKEMVTRGYQTPDEYSLLLNNCLSSYRLQHNAEPPIEKVRQLQSKVVAILNNVETDSADCDV